MPISSNYLFVASMDVDAAKGTINLLLGREMLALKTLDVPKDAKIRLVVEGRLLQELTLAQVIKPAQAIVTLSADQKNVTALEVMAPALRRRKRPKA